MSRRKEFTEEQWHDAIVKAAGVTYSIAQLLNCSRQTVWSIVKDRPDLQQLIAEQQDVCLEIAQAQIKKKLEDGDSKVLMWYMDRKGRHLGFGPTLKLDGNVSAQMVLYMPDNGREQPQTDDDDEGNETA
jgi:hypothetical protein